MKIKFCLGFALLCLLVLGALDAAKEKTDKERILALESTVQTLQSDLAGEHKWAENVNDAMDLLNSRTLDLNERLRSVETRGPVAKLGHR